MKGSKIVSILAILAAISGVIIAVGKYMKKKGITLRDALDFKNDFYAEDEDLSFDEYNIAEEQSPTITEEIGVEDETEEETNPDTKDTEKE